MKIRELFESETDAAKIIEMINEECAPFLRAAQGGLIYRGLKNPQSEFLRKEVRIDRRPKSSSQKVHELVDAWFQQQFGINGRSAALFATGELVDAQTYGRVHAIFPIGSFEFLWSPDVSDLFFQTGLDQAIIQAMRGAASKGANVEAAEAEAADKYLSKLKYTDKNFIDAIDSGNEIMIQCAEYFAVPLYTDWSEEIIKTLSA
jgi:hypothetical protein